LTAHASQLLDAAALLGISLDLWRVQNRLLVAYVELADSEAMTDLLRSDFANLAVKLNISQDLLGWRP
jgi:hypothetical protein